MLFLSQLLEMDEHKGSVRIKPITKIVGLRINFGRHRRAALFRSELEKLIVNSPVLMRK